MKTPDLISPLPSNPIAAGAQPATEEIPDGHAAPGNVILRSFRKGDGEAFRALNEQWITHYFRLEPQDLELLGDPETHILACGGKIIVAAQKEEVIGCCALLALGSGVFEVARLAVRVDHRGRGIGRSLLHCVIGIARVLKAPKLVLETSAILPDAVHLYESFGFRRVTPDRLLASPLARADLFMELTLSDG